MYDSKSDTRKLIQMVSTHYSGTKRQWWKMLSNQLSCTQQDHQKFIWPMPKVEYIFSQLNGMKYFSTLNLWPGHHHIPLDETSIPKRAFTSPFGKYEYIKVPFGLAQALAYFQELMTGVLKAFPFAITYLDDIIIFSRTAEEHLYHIRQDFEKSWTTHLSMKLSKWCYFAKEIRYLGHILSTMNIRPLPLTT